MNVSKVKARVTQIRPLTDSILQLCIEPETYIQYLPGQYLQIELNDDFLSYSIANAPLGAKQYEIHMRHAADNSANQSLIQHIKAEGCLNIILPLGDCHLDQLDRSRPILFIAGGTGFAPVKAMIEQLLADGKPPVFELFWGARSQSDLYMDNKVNYWQQHVAQFSYFSCLSGSGKSSLAELVLEKHSQDIKEWQVVIAGPFDMVYKTRDLLVAHGAKKEDLYSDAFSFEPKQDKK